MPPSDFKKLKRSMTDVIFQLAMAQQLRQTCHAVVDQDDAVDDDLLPDLVRLRHALDSVRYSVPRKNVVRSPAHQRMLYTLGGSDFARVSKATFNVLLDLIRDDMVFQSQRNKTMKPQRDVAIQLAVTFEWYGAHGNAGSIAHLVRSYGIAAGSISSYVRRVQKALLRHYTSFVAWPSRQKRIESSAFHEERFGLIDGVVGFVDGTHVILDQTPHINGALHFNRKCRYSFNVQIVYNEDKVILHAYTGWPGSCCDSTVFSKTLNAQHPERFFSGDQYLVGDTGYALSTRLITPFKLPASLEDGNTFYNEVISSARVINENCIGLFKNRWMSLKGVRTQIKRKEDFRHVNNQVLARAMLHNIGIALFDEWEDLVRDDDDDEDMEINAAATGGTAAREKREHIKNALLRR